MRLFLAWLFGGLLVLGDSAVQAQLAQNLQVELSPTSPPVRLNRPMLTLWALRSQVDPVVEGRLLLDLRDAETTLSSHVIDDVVLTESPQQLSLLLPPLTHDAPLDQIEVRVRFETRGQVLELQPQMLRIPTSRQTALMALVGEPPTTGSRPRRRDLLISRTQFETFAPEEQEEDYQTVVSSLRSQDFPQNALAYCQFDAVYLLGDTLALLRGPQLDALRQWVRAGGSVYVELPRLVEKLQLDFLKSLTDASPEPIVWHVTSQGQIELDSLPSPPLLSLRSGLGRVLVRISDGEPREDPLDDPEFRRGFAELWRLAPPRVAAVLDHGHWDPTLRGQDIRGPEARNLQNWAAQGLSQTTDQALAAEVLAHRVGDYLSPRGLKLMPFWLIASMLAGLVVWIGPGEYLLLGRLRLRKWTWLTFPCAILAMTGVTVWLANRAMAGAENGYAMQMFDYAPAGELVRSHALSLHIPAVSGNRTVEIDDALYADVSSNNPFIQQSTQTTWSGNRRVTQRVLLDRQTGRIVVVAGGLPAGADGPRRLTVAGRVPRKYAVTQPVKQWTPNLSRTFSIPGRPPIANLDWSQVDIQGLMSAEQMSRGFLPPALVESVRQVFGPTACVAAILPRGAMLSDGRHDPLAEISPPGGDKRQAPLGLRSRPDTPADHWREFVVGATVNRQSPDRILRDTEGLRGGGVLLDLPLIDAHSGHWVLVVAVPRGQTVEVYRKLCPLPEPVVSRTGI